MTCTWQYADYYGKNKKNVYFMMQYMIRNGLIFQFSPVRREARN